VNNQLKSLVAGVRLFRRAKEMRLLATFAFIGVAAVSLFLMPSCGKDSKSRGEILLQMIKGLKMVMQKTIHREKCF
jgi:hypothetical protein